MKSKTSPKETSSHEDDGRKTDCVRYFRQTNNGNEILYRARLISNAKFSKKLQLGYKLTVSAEECENIDEEYFCSRQDVGHRAEAIFAISHNEQTLLHLDIAYPCREPLMDDNGVRISLISLQNVMMMTVIDGREVFISCYDLAKPFELAGSDRLHLQVVSPDDNICIDVEGYAIKKCPDWLDRDLTIKSFKEIFDLKIAEKIARAVARLMFVVSRP